MGDYSYERYAKIRDFRGLTDYKVTKLAGIKGTATISNWKNGKYTPKDDKMQDIAQVLGVTVDFLSGKTDTIECKECGEIYNPFDEFDCALHEHVHDEYMKWIAVYPSLPNRNAALKISASAKNTMQFHPEQTVDVLQDYLKAEYATYLYCYSGYDGELGYDEFCKTKLYDLISDGTISTEYIDDVIKIYNLDPEFIDKSSVLINRARKNEQLMRIITYAEKLSKKSLDLLEAETKIISEHDSKE